MKTQPLSPGWLKVAEASPIESFMSASIALVGTVLSLPSMMLRTPGLLKSTTYRPHTCAKALPCGKMLRASVRVLPATLSVLPSSTTLRVPHLKFSGVLKLTVLPFA